MSDVQLDFVVPAADLSEFVSLFYNFHANLPIFEDTERAGNAQFRIRLSPGSAEYRFHDGSVQRTGDFHLIGPTSGPRVVRADGPVHVFGLGLTAAGWSALLGNDASSMLNRAMDSTELFGASRMRAAQEAMRRETETAAIIAIGEALIRQLIREGDQGALGFVRQVDAWLAGSPSPEMETLIAITGLSRRQVERKCNSLYGAPPKLLARKYRALRAAVAMATDDVNLDDIIARGFYDQSHLIREVKQFTGLTPRQIKAEPSLLVRLTMMQRHTLDGQVSPLVSGT